MADKVGANKIFVRIFLVGFLLALLLVGALLSIFYHGTLSTYIAISLVLLPSLALLVIYVTVVLEIFHRGEARLDDKQDEAIISSYDNTEAKSIIIYGSEFSDPFYKQLTMPQFVGKALPKSSKAKSAGRSSSRNRPVTRATYAEFTDDYNGVTQGQMSFDNWLDVLRDEPMIVEVSDREATLMGQLSEADLDEYREMIGEEQTVSSDSKSKKLSEPTIEVKADVEDAMADKKPARPREAKSPRQRSASDKSSKGNLDKESTTSGAQVVEISPVIIEPAVVKEVVSATKITKTPTRTAVSKKTNKATARPRKIITHKKPANDKRDDYVYIRQPIRDTNQPIKQMLSERFEYINTNTTRSASQELLAKMRRDNTRR